jgi:hypothetical protein
MEEGRERCEVLETTLHPSMSERVCLWEGCSCKRCSLEAWGCLDLERGRGISGLGFTKQSISSSQLPVSQTPPAQCMIVHSIK